MPERGIRLTFLTNLIPLVLSCALSGIDIELSWPATATTFNLKRLALVIGLLAGVLAAALVWINLFHRRVEERTQQLGDQIRQRQRIERERALSPVM